MLLSRWLLNRRQAEPEREVETHGNKKLDAPNASCGLKFDLPDSVTLVPDEKRRKRAAERIEKIVWTEA